MANEDDSRAAARRLASQAHQVGRVPDRERWRVVLRWITRGRAGNRRSWAVPVLGTPWQDAFSVERPGWRCRAAYLDGEEVFAVDYQVCRRCGLGWG